MFNERRRFNDTDSNILKAFVFGTVDDIQTPKKTVSEGVVSAAAARQKSKSNDEYGQYIQENYHLHYSQLYSTESSDVKQNDINLLNELRSDERKFYIYRLKRKWKLFAQKTKKNVKFKREYGKKGISQNEILNEIAQIKPNRIGVKTIRYDNKSNLAKRILNNFKWQADVHNKLKKVIRGIILKLFDKIGYDQTCRIAQILERYQHYLGKSKFDIGCIPDVEYKIRMKDGVEPKARRYIPMPPEHDEEIRRTVELLLEAGIIEPYEGPWASQCFCVRNSDGSSRMVINYDYINKHSYSDSYPVPSVPEYLTKFHGKTIFSTFDVLKAFHNIKVAADTKKYTAFTCKYGTFVWNFMPFGGKQNPAVWARASDMAFKSCIDMIKYCDDVVLASKEEHGRSEVENHITAIESFFVCLEKYNLKIKLSKCEWFVKKVKFLGNIITPEGRSVDDNYVKNLLRFRHPQGRKELKAYLGAVEWISKHIYGLKSLFIPLQHLIKTKTPWQWGSKEKAAFIKIQCMIQKCELLHHPDWNEPFYVFCDASQGMMSGALFQKRNNKYVVIDMWSKCFPKAAKNKHITTKELLALIECFKLWKRYFILNKVFIHSDSRNLKYLFKLTEEKRSNNPKHYEWVLLLSQYNFEVRFIPGIYNIIADYLSRYVDASKMRNYLKDADKNMSQYNAHKRFKIRKRKKKKDWKNDQIRQQKQLFNLKHAHKGRNALNWNDIDSNCWENDESMDGFQDIYYQHLMDTLPNVKEKEHFIKESVGDKYIQKRYGNVLEQRMDMVQPYYSYWAQSRIIKMKLAQQLLPQQRRKSKRLAGKRIDYGRKANIKRAAFVMPEFENQPARIAINESKSAESRFNENELEKLSKLSSNGVSKLVASTVQNDLEQINNADAIQQDIIERVHGIRGISDLDNKLSGIIDEDSHSVDEDWALGSSQATGPVIPYRVYADELLKDKCIETIDRFSKEKLIQNQKEFVVYAIIINHIKGIDLRDDYKTLPKRIKNDVARGYYTYKDELLWYVGESNEPRICLPPQHVEALLRYYHRNKLYGGHQGTNALIHEVRQRFYWRGYDKDIREFAKCCHECQKAKGIPNRKLGYFQAFDATRINEIVCIDHVGVLPITNDGFRYVTTYYDRYSGYTKSVAAKSIDAFTTAVNFVNNWICVFGAPETILTDLGSDFRSEIVSNLVELVKTKHVFTTAYNPATDGAVERFNRTLKGMLRCISAENRLDFAVSENNGGCAWNIFIPYINSVHNNRLSRRTNHKLCPNEIFIGRRLPMPLDFVLKDTGYFKTKKGPYYHEFIKNMIEINGGIADKEMIAYRNKMRKDYDENKKAPEFDVNDFVLYWNGPYPAKGRRKMALNWTGPYRILTKFNNGVNYLLQHAEYKKIYFVANVRRIRRYNPPKLRRVLPDHITDDSEREKRQKLDNFSQLNEFEENELKKLKKRFDIKWKFDLEQMANQDLNLSASQIFEKSILDCLGSVIEDEGTSIAKEKTEDLDTDGVIDRYLEKSNFSSIDGSDEASESVNKSNDSSTNVNECDDEKEEVIYYAAPTMQNLNIMQGLNNDSSCADADCKSFKRGRRT